MSIDLIIICYKTLWDLLAFYLNECFTCFWESIYFLLLYNILYKCTRQSRMTLFLRISALIPCAHNHDLVTENYYVINCSIRFVCFLSVPSASVWRILIWCVFLTAESYSIILSFWDSEAIFTVFLHVFIFKRLLFLDSIYLKLKVNILICFICIFTYFLYGFWLCLHFNS